MNWLTFIGLVVVVCFLAHMSVYPVSDNEERNPKKKWK